MDFVVFIFEVEEMTDKEKQIEEMAKVIMGAVSVTIQYVQASANETEARIEAKALIAAGYRKASDVIDEFVERLKEENEISFRRYGKGIGISTIFRIADEMRQEVEK